ADSRRPAKDVSTRSVPSQKMYRYRSRLQAAEPTSPARRRAGDEARVPLLWQLRCFSRRRSTDCPLLARRAVVPLQKEELPVGWYLRPAGRQSLRLQSADLRKKTTPPAPEVRF